MITVEEAELLIASHIPAWGQSFSDIEDLTWRQSDEPLIADRAYPAIDRVTMDGIAVSWESYASGARGFPVAGICAAGSVPAALPSQTSCLEVMTGAALPTGADLVIPYEHLKIENGAANIVVAQDRLPFANVHRLGSDFSVGDQLLKAGAVLQGPQWGIAASLGYTQVKCRRIPKIMVVSTGDELIAPSVQPLAHQVRRSNAYAIRASLVQNGFTQVDLDHLPDDMETVRTHFVANRNTYDVMIFSGGVSKGKFDYLPQVWLQMGVEKLFHEVSQRPGKPLWFGVDREAKTTVIGLPGNPISSLVCLYRYFLNLGKPSSLYARLSQEIEFTKPLTYFLPVKTVMSADAVLHAHPLKAGNSGEFSALAESDGFIELPKDQSRFTPGESFRFFPWNCRS